MEKRFFNNNKKYILLLPVAIIVGTIFANFAGVDKIKSWGIFSAEYMDKFLSVNIKFSSVLSYVFRKRIKLLIVVALACMTRIKDKLALLVCAYWGFSAGVIIASLSMQYGASYLVIFFCGILCHMVLYGIGICGMFMNKGSSDRKSMALKYAIYVLVYMSGMIVEALMNCYVLPAVLSRF